jgi:hypothetical protein
VDTGEKCHWSHACKSFTRTCVGSNDILECKIPSENAHRTNPQPYDPNPTTAESMVNNAHRTKRLDAQTSSNARHRSFSIWTEFTVTTRVREGDTREAKMLKANPY